MVRFALAFDATSTHYSPPHHSPPHPTPIPSRAFTPRICDGTRVPTRQPGGPCEPQETRAGLLESLAALRDLTVPGVASRHPRAAILGPARASGSATPPPFHTDRIDVGRLIRRSRPSQRTALLRHARRRAGAKASWTSTPNGLRSRRRPLPRQVLDPNAPSGAGGTRIMTQLEMPGISPITVNPASSSRRREGPKGASRN